MENAVTVIYNIQILENVTPSKGKIIAMANDKPLVRLQMKKPCDHLFMGPLIRAMLNVSQNCVFKKGNYSLNINIEEVAQKYYGGSFLYGNLTFRSVFYTDDCNFSCAVVQVDIFPKNKTLN
ncbi:uncharacterized protein [Epargyreus clarus]|uniref:uncharacterized protein n=1 Tax=Epargyreus clarus TaxID=520877 RepID=UPI003C2F0C8E